MIRLLLVSLGFVVLLTACGFFDSPPPEEEATPETQVTQEDQAVQETPETQEIQEDQEYKERVLQEEKVLAQQEKEAEALTPVAADEPLVQAAAAEATAQPQESPESIQNLFLPPDSEEEDVSASEELTDQEAAAATDADPLAEFAEAGLAQEGAAEEEATPEEVVDPEAIPLLTETESQEISEAEAPESEGTALAAATAVDTEFREVEEAPPKAAPTKRKRKNLDSEERTELLENIHGRLLKAQELGLPMVRDPRAEQLVQAVYFGFDDSRLTKEFLEQLIAEAPAVLEELETRGDLILQIEGHADERGDEEYNLALGHRRANTIHNLLKIYVIDPTTLRTISFGEEFPAIPESNKQAWAKNRRVAFTFLLREP